MTNPKPFGPLRRIILKIRKSQVLSHSLNIEQKITYGGFKFVIVGPSLDGLTSRLLAELPPLLLGGFE